MKCSVFIASSLDGYIAKDDESVDWLHTAGNPDIDMGQNADMGMNEFLSTIDCMIMGRKTMDIISSMSLTPEQWPYGDTRIIVLSNTLDKAPENLPGNIEVYSGDIHKLISTLENQGFKHAYVDGGTTIQNFINLKLINEMTITIAPILLGSGKPLFGKTFKDIKLEKAEAEAFPNDFVQVKYKVNYS